MRWIYLLVGAISIGLLPVQAEAFESDLIESDLTNIRRTLVAIPIEGLTKEEQDTQAFLAQRLLEDIYSLRIAQQYLSILRGDIRPENIVSALLDAKLAYKTYSPLSPYLAVDIARLKEGKQVDFALRTNGVEKTAAVHTFGTLQLLKSKHLAAIAEHLNPVERSQLREDLSSLANRGYCYNTPFLHKGVPPSRAYGVQETLRKLEGRMPRRQRMRLYAIQSIFDSLAGPDEWHGRAERAYAADLLTHHAFLSEIRSIAVDPVAAVDAAGALCLIHYLTEGAKDWTALKTILSEEARNRELDWALKLGFPGRPEWLKTDERRTAGAI